MFKVFSFITSCLFTVSSFAEPEITPEENARVLLTLIETRDKDVKLMSDIFDLQKEQAKTIKSLKKQIALAKKTRDSLFNYITELDSALRKHSHFYDIPETERELSLQRRTGEAELRGMPNEERGSIRFSPERQRRSGIRFLRSTKPSIR